MALASIQFAFIFAIIGIGYLVKRLKFMNESDSDALSRLIFNVTLPCLALSKMIKITVSPELFILMAAGFFSGVILQFIVRPFIKNKPDKIKGLFVLNVSGYNIGLLAYPVAEALWGAPGIAYMMMFDLGNAFIVFGLNYIIGGKYSEHDKITSKDIFKKLCSSVPFMTFIVAIIIMIFKIPLPEFLLTIFEKIAVANAPLSLLLLGLNLTFLITKDQISIIAKILSIRYLFAIICGAILFFFIPAPLLFKLVIFMSLLLPIGLTSMIMGFQFGYDRKISSSINNISIIVSLIFLWLVFGLIFPMMGIVYN